LTSITPNTSPLELAAIIARALEDAALTAVLSGGAAVSIYSGGRYESSDLDFVSSEQISRLAAALTPLGFTQADGRHFEHPNTDYYVEFPPGPLAVGGLLITEWDQLQTDLGVIHILSPTQIVMDRLAAFIHWNDPPSLDQAVLVAQKHPLDWESLEDWVSREGGQEKYETFRRALQRATND
jgi:hypothetical protein